jgi:hypothetical protein
LDRTWIGGNVDWIEGGSTANWNPADEPDVDDTAIFNTPNTVNLGTNNSVNGLTLSGGIELFTNGQDLTVDGLVQASGAGTTFQIDDSTSLVLADTVAVNASGTIRLSGGTLTVDEETGTGFLDINAGGTFTGFGTVNLNDAPGAVTSLLINDGTLSAFRQGTILNPPLAGTLTINASAANARINLDGGAEAGVVNINRNQTLEINGTLADAFSGDLNMFHNTTLDISSAWSMDGGTFDVSNGFIDSPFPSPDVPDGTATIAGGAFTQTGGTILNFASDGTLIFDVAYSQNGGTFTNNGLVEFNGSTIISSLANMTMPTNTSSITVGSGAIVNVDQANFNVDGNGTATNVIRVNSGGQLDLDLGAGADDTITGTVILSGGELDVTTADNTWSLGGSVSTVAGSGTSQLNGEALTLDGATVTVPAGSTLDINASSTWNTGTDFEIDGMVTVDGAVTLNSIPANPVNGTGTLRFGSTSNINGINTQITVSTFDWDGTTTGQVHTFATDAQLFIDATTFDSDGDMDDSITMAAGADLIVNEVAQWEMRGTLTTNGTLAKPVGIGGDARMVLTSATGIWNVNGATIPGDVTFGPGSVTNIAGGTQTIASAANDMIFDGGTITGAGTFFPHVQNSVTDDSTISVANFDFDNGGWVIDPGATLTVNVTDYDPSEVTNDFNGTITLNGGAVDFNSGDDRIVMNGALNMNSTPGSNANWTGERLDIGDDAGSLDADFNVAGSGISQISTFVNFKSDADINIVSGSTLSLTGLVSFTPVNGANHAEITGSGTLVFESDVSVSEETTINMVGGVIDLDGVLLERQRFFVNAPLEVHAATLADFGNVNSDGSDSIIVDNTGNSGVLTVILDDPDAEWTLNPTGEINLFNDNSPATLLAGSDLNVNGLLDVSGDVQIDARIDVGGAVRMNTAGEPLWLNGGNSTNDPNTIAGGTIIGPGLIGANAGRALSGFGTISAPVDFDGTAELVAAGGVLEVNGAVTDVGTIRVKSGGTLDLALPLSTAVTDSGIVMEGGTLEGGPLTIDPAVAKSLRGFGSLNNGNFNNNGTIEAQGGTLVVVVDAITHTGDLDGSTNTGRLRAAPGANLTIREFSGDGLIEFAGTVEVQNGGELLADFVGGANAFIDFVPGSSMTLTGGTFRTNTFIDLAGSMVVGSGADSLLDSSLDSIASFDLNGAFTLNGNLQVKSHGFITEGATFTGAGALHLLEESFYSLNDGADIGVLVINDGVLDIAGISAGRVDVADYQQSDTGDLSIALQGTNLNEFDRLVVDGAAQLDGMLELNLVGGFVPNVGDTFSILSASAGVSGTFTSVFQPPNMPAGLLFDVVYSPTLVQLMVVEAPIFSADFDLDGDVDGDDLDEWQTGYGIGTSQTQGDADGDGDVDGRDFLIWQRQFGSVPLTAFESINVPEPGASTIVCLAVLTCLVGRHRTALGHDKL